MTTKANFTSAEWQQLIDAPHQVYLALDEAERGGLLARRSERNALEEFLKEHKSSSTLVQAIQADQDKKSKSIKGDLAAAISQLGVVGALLENKAGAEGDAVRSFLNQAGTAIAEAVTERRGFGKKDAISDTEKEVLGQITTALRATDADARRRRQETANAQAAEAARVQAAAAAEAKARAEAEAAEAAAAATAAAAAAAAAAATEAERQAAAAAEREAAAAKEAARQQRQEMMETVRRREQEKRDELVRAKQEAEAKEAEVTAAAEATAAAEVAAAAAMRTYVVKQGDTLSHIALHFYGSANRWPEIHEANKDTIPNPRYIYPGQVIKIP